MTEPKTIDTAMHRSLAVDLFNYTWTLLDLEDRTPEQDEEMVHATHASRHHWGIAGTEKNYAVGEWQIARVYAVLKRVEPALHHAKLYLDACIKHDFSTFDLAFAHEGMARALVIEQPEQASEHIENAKRIGEGIEKDEDRVWLHTNLDEITAIMNAE